MPRALLPIHHPVGGVATMQQKVYRGQTFLPRGMLSSGSIQCTRPARDRSGKVLNPVYQAQLDAYLATRFVEVAEDHDFLRRLLAAEALEFRAAIRFTGGEFLDGTLPPRACAVILLLPEAQTASEAGRHALNAFANLASGKGCVDPRPTATVLRFAALADVDVDLFFKEAEGIDPSTSKTGISLAVRWLKEDTITTRVYDVGLHSFYEARDRIQNILFTAKHTDGAPVDDLAFASRSRDLETDFQELQAEFSRDFFALQETKVNNVDASLDLMPVEAFIRLIQRVPDAHLQHALTDQFAIHGTLLCKQSGLQELERVLASDAPLPLCENGFDQLGVHIVAVQAMETPLGRDATLYAATTRAGHSLNRGGSWVWRFETMALPYDENFSRNWYVQPCDNESCQAGQSELRAAQTNFLQRAWNLARKIAEGQQAAPAAAASAAPPATAEAPDDDEQTPAGWLMSALCLGLNSPRATLGDLGRHLSGVDHFDDFKAFVDEASLRFGTETSLPEAFAQTTAVLQLEATRVEETSAEVQLWQRLASGAKEVVVRASSPATVTPIAVENILEFLAFQADRPWKGTERIVRRLKDMVGSTEIPAEMQRRAEECVDSCDSVVELLVWVGSWYLRECTPILVLDRKNRVVRATSAGGDGTFQISIGNVYDLAKKAERLFLVDATGAVAPCRPRTAEEKAERKARRKEREKAAGAVAAAATATTAAAGAGAGAGGPSDAAAPTAAPTTEPVQRRKTIPVDMPKAPNPRFSIARMRAQSARVNVNEEAKRQRTES